MVDFGHDQKAANPAPPLPALTTFDEKTVKRARLAEFLAKQERPSVRQLRKIRRQLMQTEARIVDALGGPDDISPQKEALISVAMKALSIAHLIELYLNKHGAIRPDELKRGVVDVQPALEKSLRFYSEARQSLTAVGLERKKIDEAMNFGRYIELKKEGEKVLATGEKA
jgi:hypothetical protein